MSARDVIGVELIDPGGTVKRMAREAPKELRRRMSSVVLSTADRSAQRMGRNAPRGPDSPHIAETVTFSHSGLSAKVGYLAEDFGAQQAAEGSTATIAEVALYNEYRPNKQPFMKVSAEQESSEFARRTEAAIAAMEQSLSVGFGTPFTL